MRHRRDRYATGGGFERRDCSVRAHAVAAGITYDAAHAIYAAAGRKNRHRTPDDVTPAVMLAAGAEPVAFGNEARTLTRFLVTFPRGRFVLHTSHHALAVVDGVAHDWRPRPRARILKAWRFPEAP